MLVVPDLECRWHLAGDEQEWSWDNRGDWQWTARTRRAMHRDSLQKGAWQTEWREGRWTEAHRQAQRQEMEYCSENASSLSHSARPGCPTEDVSRSFCSAGFDRLLLSYWINDTFRTRLYEFEEISGVFHCKEYENRAFSSCPCSKTNKWKSAIHRIFR